MATFSGFCELRTPRDLLRKLEHDFGRISADPENEFAAFDFFVTAEHIVDWLHPSSKTDRKSMRASHLLVEITSHIANGAKHFIATNKHHKSVAGIERDKYVEDGYVEKGYFAEPIVVKLSPAEGAALGCQEIEAPELAQRVLDFWKARL
jgi:hypothetical protein